MASLQKPPARYTDASLLKAMEKAGRTVEDEDAREALKECGLGTAATRSGTIKKLLDDTYLQRWSRNLSDRSGDRFLLM